MIIPDANLFLYAYNSTSLFHSKSAAWWNRCLSGRETVGLCPSVVFAFIRIATGTRAFGAPLHLEEAFGHVESWLSQPAVQCLSSEPADLIDAMRLLRIAGTAGNLTADAQVAAIALRVGGTVHTADRDFDRFPGVRWLNPIASLGVSR